MRSTAGFTLVELLMVLFMVVILAAYSAPRLLSNSEQNTEFFLDELAAAYDYARIAAVSSGCPVEFSITANSYSALRPETFCDTSSFSADLAWGDGSSVAAVAADGVVLAGDVGNTIRLTPEARTNQVVDLRINSGARSLVIRAESGASEIQ